jgi:hypothetical protein
MHSSALPIEMEVCLKLVGDHVECRCGYVFQAHASFLHCREHARQCYVPPSFDGLPIPPLPAYNSKRDGHEDIAALKRMQAEAERSYRLREWASSRRSEKWLA